jgi:hypothetical protein
VIDQPPKDIFAEFRIAEGAWVVRVKVHAGGWRRRSGLGHSRHSDGLRVTSDVLSEADIVTAGRHVSKVP